jgi:hypothetical protein
MALFSVGVRFSSSTRNEKGSGVPAGVLVGTRLTGSPAAFSS